MPTNLNQAVQIVASDPSGNGTPSLLMRIMNLEERVNTIEKRANIEPAPILPPPTLSVGSGTDAASIPVVSAPTGQIPSN